MMKHNKSTGRALIWVFLLAIVIVSCKKEESYDAHLIQAQKLQTISADQTKSSFSILKGIYPQLAPLIVSTVFNLNIYKITYNTTFKKQNCAGLGYHKYS
ncbi:MAG: hypothetical protein HC906_16895 [Bacteroidales bacterium]|nr:hypothetical protein [Bacteroidales bacterium]